LVPVGISVGEPRFPLNYTPVYLRRLAPWGLLEVHNRGEFAQRYRDRLDAVGIDAVRRQFRTISADHDSRGLVLLCFEPIGQFCHRRVFAEWFEQQDGQPVPELPDDRLSLFE
jgi:Protein of unknown function, DUF488